MFLQRWRACAGKGVNRPLELQWWERWEAWDCLLRPGPSLLLTPSGVFTKNVGGIWSLRKFAALSLGKSPGRKQGLEPQRQSHLTGRVCAHPHSIPALGGIQNRDPVSPHDHVTVTYHMLRQYTWTLGFRPRVFWKLSATLQYSHLCWILWISSCVL